MKRNLYIVGILVLVLAAAACATAPAAPSLKGVVTQINGNSVTVKPAEGEATTFTMDWGTQVFWDNGLKAGKSVLTVGHPVHVYLTEGTTVAKKIVIANL